MFTTTVIKTKHTYEEGVYFIIDREECAVELHLDKWGFHSEKVLFEEITGQVGTDLRAPTPEEVHMWIESNEDSFLPINEPLTIFAHNEQSPNREFLT